VAKASEHSDRIKRIYRACTTLEELQEETHQLYLSITANARQARAAAGRTRKPKPSARRR
jgi:hypothetical protein